MLDDLFTISVLKDSGEMFIQAVIANLLSYIMEEKLLLNAENEIHMFSLHYI